MILTKALKKLSRLTGDIKKLDRQINESFRVKTYLSTDPVIPMKTMDPYYVTENLLKKRAKLKQDIIDLKNKIMAANVSSGAYDLIVRLAEEKGQLNMLELLRLNADSRMTYEGHDDVVDRVTEKGQLSIAELDIMMEESQANIDNIIEDLDQINSDTHI